MRTWRPLAAGPWTILLLLLVFLLDAAPRIAAATGAPVRRMRQAGVTPQDANETFPTTQVGQTSTLCSGFCFCSGPCPGGYCDGTGSGVAESSHLPAPPFAVYNFLVEPYVPGSVDCASGVPVQLPVTLGVGQQLAFTLSFSPTSPGSFSDYLDLSGFAFDLSGSTPSGEASLVPAPLSGWSAPLVVSTSPGTQTDSANLTSAEPLYLSWSIENQGNLSTFGTFFVDVDLDGNPLSRWSWSDPLPPGWFLYYKDYKFGPLAAGTHTLELIPDPTDVIGAGSSTYTKTITVSNPAPPPPPPKPTTSTSWYVRATGKTYGTDSGLYAWAHTAGAAAGTLNSTSGGADFVILDFGSPLQLADGSYGANGFGRTKGLSATQITNTAESFIRGYDSVAHHALFLAIGTSNYQPAGAKQPNVTTAHAQAWAQMLVALEQWSANGGYRVHLAAASDAELGWNSPQTTQGWFQAFTDEIAASGSDMPIYDYGDAAGCPRTPATAQPQPCPVKNSPYHWTQGDIAGLGALFVPEIYNKATAREWQEISQYIELSLGATGWILGVLTENQACAQRGGPTACPGIDNTADLAWQQLVAALGGSPDTSPGLPNLSWSTDIKYTY